MANDVTFQHPDYEHWLSEWELIDDVCQGERAVKSGGVKYLPMPNPDDKSPDNKKRYENYKARAVFYEATKRTVKGLLGAAFKEVPTLEVPGVIQYVDEDVDGCGVSVFQQSQLVVRDVLKKGRHALHVDYPTVDEPGSVSIAQNMSGNIRGTIQSVAAQKVVNWRVEKVGGKYQYTLVVMAETYQEPTEDGFGFDIYDQYRVLRLENGVYSVEIWRETTENRGNWYIYQQYIPRDGRGGAWEVIPFMFVGAENNDYTIDDPPIDGLARLNLAHYRNSADYEDSAYFVGQAQPVITGLDETWRDWLQAQGLYAGSRSVLPLPKDADFKYAQVNPNTLIKEAMDQKEAQMVALGARLIEKGSAVKTATQENNENQEEHSVLSLVVQNVSEAYTMALQWLSRFMNGPDTGIEYTISTDFIEHKIDAPMLSALIQALQSGKYPESDFWAVLKRTGLIDGEKTDEDIRGELETSDMGLGLDDPMMQEPQQNGDQQRPTE